MIDVEREEIDKAFRDALATNAGKRVIFWFLEQSAIYQDAFAGENTNATNYMLGSQAPGRKLIAQLDQLDPRAYPTLLLDIAEIKEIDRLASAARNKQEGEDDEEQAP